MTSTFTRDVLQSVLDGIVYRSGWEFALADTNGHCELHVIALTQDSYQQERQRFTQHSRIVPPASYNERAWLRWVFDFVVAVETHEACEFFVVDGRRPYAPHHGAGENPYTVFEHRSLDVSADDSAVTPGMLPSPTP